MQFSEQPTFVEILNLVRALTVPDSEVQKQVRLVIAQNIHNTSFVASLIQFAGEAIANPSIDIAQKYSSLILLNSVLKQSHHDAIIQGLNASIQGIIVACINNENRLVRRGGLLLINNMGEVKDFNGGNIMVLLASKLQQEGLTKNNFDLLEGYIWLLEELVYNEENSKAQIELLLCKEFDFLNKLILDLIVNVNRENFDAEVVNKCLNGLALLFALQARGVRENMIEIVNSILRIVAFCGPQTRTLVFGAIFTVVDLRKDVVNACRQNLVAAILYTMENEQGQQNNDLRFSGVKSAMLLLLEILTWWTHESEIKNTIFEELKNSIAALSPILIKLMLFTPQDYELLKSQLEQSANQDNAAEDNEDIFDVENEGENKISEHWMMDERSTLRSIAVQIAENLLRVFPDETGETFKQYFFGLLKSANEQEFEIGVLLLGLSAKNSTVLESLVPFFPDIMQNLSAILTENQRTEVTVLTSLSTINSILGGIFENEKENEYGFNLKEFIGAFLNYLVKSIESGSSLLKIECAHTLNKLFEYNKTILVENYDRICELIGILLKSANEVSILSTIDVLIGIESALERSNFGEMMGTNNSLTIETRAQRLQPIVKILMELFYANLNSFETNRILYKLIELFSIYTNQYLVFFAEDMAKVYTELLQAYNEVLRLYLNSQKTTSTRRNEHALSENLKLILEYVSFMVEKSGAQIFNLPVTGSWINVLIMTFQLKDFVVRSFLWGILGELVKSSPQTFEAGIHAIKAQLTDDLYYSGQATDAGNFNEMLCTNCCFAFIEFIDRFPLQFADIVPTVLGKIERIFETETRLKKILAYNLTYLAIRTGRLNLAAFTTSLPKLIKQLSACLCIYNNPSEKESIAQNTLIFTQMVREICLGASIDRIVSPHLFSFFLEMTVQALSDKPHIAGQIKPLVDELITYLVQTNKDFLVKSSERVSARTKNYIWQFGL
jgi:hypothetical protein